MQARHHKRFTLAALVAALLLSGIFLASQAVPAWDGWVRTVDGWQRAESLRPPKPNYEPALHPAIVASLVSLASLMVLIAFPAGEQQ